MVLEELRRETKEVHTALEKIIVPQLKSTGITSYIHLLNNFYGYYQSVESRIDKYVTEDIIPRYNDRRKAATILQDLSAMGQTGVTPKLCTELPDINNIYGALGAMYVLEGSTLGGKIISKMLIQNLQLHSAEGVCFFGGYGAETDSMWQSFISALDAYPANKEEQQQIVAGAKETFSKFRKWILANEKQ